ncbi:hypothetical protein V502_10676 [Pseudogymnoascus sp. VKM F-4520 (FW-2644)]|nr:hypothetical protein V502_10676 [Pseudogymnoascus sp. VKM F-4520 (FW-2644)]
MTPKITATASGLTGSSDAKRSIQLQIYSARLAQEEQLRQNAHALEDQREVDDDVGEWRAPGLLGDHGDEGAEEEGAEERVGAEAIGHLALAGAGEDAGHDEEDVERGDDVEDFEDEVPVVVVGVLPEEVDVAGAEDEGIEGLGDDGDTWGDC